MDNIKEMLLNIQSEIMLSLEREYGVTRTEGLNDVGDEGDHASVERTREFYRLLSKRDQKKLEQIQRALKKLDKNEYGICEECEEPIEEKRLMAVPFTRLCFDCQSSEEINYREDNDYDEMIDYGIKDDDLY